MAPNTRFLLIFGLIVLHPAVGDPAAAQSGDGVVPDDAANEAATAMGEDQIAFTADDLAYDYEADIVTASGNVIVNRDGYELRADQVVWNRNTGEVLATGQIRSRDYEGNLIYADSLTVTDTLRAGVIENMLLVLEDGGRLAAKEGQREADGSYQLTEAAYTGCEVVDADGCPKDPSWQIRAKNVRYDPVRERVDYDGARMELFGLPVIPLPGLSHPIGDQTRSGFLLPDFRIDNTNGVELAVPYYFRLGPDSDALVTTHIYTEVLPMVGANYRKLFGNGAIQLGGYATSSTRLSTSAAQAGNQQKDFRGYFETNGQFNFAPNWTLTHAGRIVTDRTFLRRYDISDDDRLRSTISVQHIDDNSYFAIDGWAFQTLRPNDPQNQVPVALPRIEYRQLLSDPVLGGQILLHANSLSIGRGSGQDTQRAFAAARWDLRRLTTLGQQVTFTAYARGDLYHSDDNILNPVPFYGGQSGWQGRAVASGAIDIQWPFVGEAFGGVQTLTPRVQIVATPTIRNLDIPNEDSRAVDLSDVNLFSLNRFPGYDRYEDNVRITYGAEWQLNRPNWQINAQIGQSYRLANNSNIVPEGTGLSDRFSDVVGRTEVRFKNFVKFDHRFRLDKDNLAVRRNEVDVTVGSSGTYVSAGYLRLNRDIGAQLEDLADREELRIGGRVQVDRYWSVFGSAIIDLTDSAEDPLSNADGLEFVRHRLGVFYDDGCLEMGLTWRYDYDDSGDAQRGSTFLLRFALRNLGV